MFFVPGLNVAASAVRFAALGAAVLFVLNWLKSNCGCVRRWDVRKIPGVKKVFLKLGIDEYPEFHLIVSVHSLKDVANQQSSSGKFYVYVNAKYEFFQTRVSSTGKFEQTAKLRVPQGAEEVTVSIYSASAVMQDVLIGSASVHVLKFLGPLAEEYLAKKKSIKVVSPEGASGAGLVTITFRKADASTQLEAELPLVSGLDPDQRPALYGELLEFFEDPGQRRNLKNSEKLAVLSKVLTGKLTVSSKGVFGKNKKTSDAGVFWAVVELAEDEEDRSSSGSSSRSGGDGPAARPKTGGVRKWYLASYESQKEFTRDAEAAEMTIPLLAVTSVHKFGASEKETGFSVRFVERSGEGEKQKKELFFQVGPGRDVDVWVDGLEIFREELREMKVQSRTRKEEWAALSEAEKFNQWVGHYRTLGYSEDELKKYYQQYQLALMGDQQRLATLKVVAKQAVAATNSEIRSSS